MRIFLWYNTLMVFSSLTFLLLFLPAMLAVYFAFRSIRWRNAGSIDRVSAVLRLGRAGICARDGVCDVDRLRGHARIQRGENNGWQTRAVCAHADHCAGCIDLLQVCRVFRKSAVLALWLQRTDADAETPDRHFVFHISGDHLRRGRIPRIGSRAKKLRAAALVCLLLSAAHRGPDCAVWRHRV